jgi:CheY-like chemotaxis protein
LVVEDEASVRNYTVEALRELGIRSLSLRMEHRRYNCWRRPLNTKPELIRLFTDVVLPGGMTGAQVAARAREIYPAVKVLFTTGYARNATFITDV